MRFLTLQLKAKSISSSFLLPSPSQCSLSPLAFTVSTTAAIRHLLCVSSYHLLCRMLPATCHLLPNSRAVLMPWRCYHLLHPVPIHG